MSLRPNRPSALRRARENADLGEATIGPRSDRRAIRNSGENSGECREARPAESGFPLPRKYSRAEELGRGGWGVVERVFDQHLDREVALKRILDLPGDQTDLQAQFLHEARITSQMQHPGVVPVHELGDDAGGMFYVMKLLRGETFHELIRRTHSGTKSRPADVSRLEDWVHPLLERLIDVCRTVAYAHQRGILHRDLKPANVMVGSFGETIVLDWGLAKEIEPHVQEKTQHVFEETMRHGGDTGPRSSTASDSGGRSQRRSECDGTIVGTPAYMSPEQARGEVTQLDARSDVYSLGVILYEIITGRHPHSGHRTKHILERVSRGTYEPLRERLPNAPRALVAIAECAMSADPGGRYRTAEDLAKDIQCWMLGQAVSVHPDRLIERSLRWCRRNQSLASVVVSSIALLLVVSVTFSVFLKRAHAAEMQARLQAEQDHREAMEAKRVAHRRMVEARDAADQWLVELSGTLEFHPGLEDVRKELLDKAVSHYTSLLDPEASSPGKATEDVLERARCFIRLADAQRLRGSDDHGIAGYRQAGELLRSVQVPGNRLEDLRLVSKSDETEEIDTQVKLEEAQAVIGRLLAGDHVEVGEVASVSKMLVGWLPFDEAVDDGGSLSWQAASAYARLQLAWYRSHWQPDENASSNRVTETRLQSRLQDAVRWTTWLAKNRGRKRDYQLLAVSHMSLAQDTNEHGSKQEAIAHWQELTRVLTELNGKLDEAPRLQQVAHARLRCASLMASSGRVEPAISEYESAITDLNQSWQLCDPDDFYRSHLADAEFELAQLLRQDPQRRAASLIYLERALETYRELMQQHPSLLLLRRTTEVSRVLGHSRDSYESRIAALENACVGYEMIRDHAELSSEEALAWLETLIELGEANQETHRDPERITESITAWNSMSMRVLIPMTLQERLARLGISLDEQPVTSVQPSTSVQGP